MMPVSYGSPYVSSSRTNWVDLEINAKFRNKCLGMSYLIFLSVFERRPKVGFWVAGGVFRGVMGQERVPKWVRIL